MLQHTLSIRLDGAFCSYYIMTYVGYVLSARFCTTVYKCSNWTGILSGKKCGLRSLSAWMPYLCLATYGSLLMP